MTGGLFDVLRRCSFCNQPLCARRENRCLGIGRCRRASVGRNIRHTAERVRGRQSGTIETTAKWGRRCCGRLGYH